MPLRKSQLQGFDATGSLFVIPEILSSRGETNSWAISEDSTNTTSIGKAPVKATDPK